jgi:SAM-dependent methyltransferase
MFTQSFWDERYGSRDALWSGNPNPRLVEHDSPLAPGAALDVGCGEGADAIWLAERGWQVTALDVSPVAMERGARRAAELDAELARRIDWVQADLLAWTGPEPDAYDLVSAQFMHLPPEPRASLFRRLAASVRAGGTLLIVAHDFSDTQIHGLRPHGDDELFYTAGAVAATLDPDRWEVIHAAAVPRTATHPDGHPMEVHDAVLNARRITGRRAR